MNKYVLLIAALLLLTGCGCSVKESEFELDDSQVGIGVTEKKKEKEELVYPEFAPPTYGPADMIKPTTGPNE